MSFVPLAKLYPTFGQVATAWDPWIVSDKGLLESPWTDYVRHLRWTARRPSGDSDRQVPRELDALESCLGIEASMWRELVWNFQRYFRRSSCAGSPVAMARDAERHGKRWHRGQRLVRECFAAVG